MSGNHTTLTVEKLLADRDKLLPKDIAFIHPDDRERFDELTASMPKFWKVHETDVIPRGEIFIFQQSSKFDWSD